ncbi:C6 zinc finger domain protein [Colletotrichum tofieldiae]|nr:C6 zinc finger domain protein [Colletotrichum tofieldiae]GKT71330.1 C6 zinc finger domain protein [Colletotrichum tofieldiae]
MVGVPGRSKGCNTCRKRKKGCQKAGIDCAGYERKRIFVNVTHPVATSNSKAVVPVVRTVVQTPSLSQSAFEDKVFDLFWEGYMPEAPLCTPGSPIVRYSNADWATTVRDLYRTDIALRQSLLALSLGTIGRRDKQQWMIDDGLKFYCEALSELNAALRHPKRWKTDALMLASRILGFYELLYGADDRERHGISQAESWEGHTQGEMALVLQRTPQAHVEGRAHDLFSSGRLHLVGVLWLLELDLAIITHIKRRRRCPLSHPVWKTVPWQNVAKTPKDVLVDIFVDVPGLLEDLDHLRSCKDDFEKESRRLRLIKECWRIDEELNWWLDNLSPRKELEELMARGLDNPSACDVVVASIMSLCWTISLLSYSTLRLAIGEKTGLELPKRTDPLIYCAKIASIVDIFFHPSAGTFGIQSAPLPIGMALVYLNSSEEGFNSETKWKLVSFFGRTANNGIGIGKFLLSTQRDGLASKTTTPVTPDGIKTKAKSWMGTTA